LVRLAVGTAHLAVERRSVLSLRRGVGFLRAKVRISLCAVNKRKAFVLK